jgi:hypothetical protein
MILQRAHRLCEEYMTIDYSHLADSMLKENGNIKVPVTGDSMSPVLRTGDTIYVESTEAAGAYLWVTFWFIRVKGTW